MHMKTFCLYDMLITFLFFSFFDHYTLCFWLANNHTQIHSIWKTIDKYHFLHLYIHEWFDLEVRVMSSFCIFNTNWYIAPLWVPLHHYSQVVYGELHSTEGWVTKHISDHSGFHYRQFLLKCLSQQAEKLSEQLLLNYRNIVQKEMYLITDLIKSYPGHEALWYHRYDTFI